MNVEVVQRRLWEQPSNIGSIVQAAKDCDGVRPRAESLSESRQSGEPDAWKLARPVRGWGRGEIPRPTPREFEIQLRAFGVRDRSEFA